MRTDTGVCDKCKKETECLTDCYLPIQEGVHERLCPVCLKEDGSYCLVCGQYCSGMESFDFIHPGYCDNCYDEITSDDDWDDEENLEDDLSQYGNDELIQQPDGGFLDPETGIMHYP